MNKIEIIPLKKIPVVKIGDDITNLISTAMDSQRIKLKEKDIIVIAHKIVSISEDRFVKLKNYNVTKQARKLSKQTGKSDKICQVIIDNSKKIIKVAKGFVITENKLGIVTANSGIDESNIKGNDLALLLPKNPNTTAKKISLKILKERKLNIPVLISDSVGRPWRYGLTQISIGSYGIAPIKTYKKDLYNKTLYDTQVPIVDELSSMAGILMEKDIAIPVVIIRGYNYPLSRLGSQVLSRVRKDDVFR